ncbi:OmpA family protein [Olleya sp. HaHaR_3_96]|uniref:OmpA family protein n=1 Tax=Olleya sp. HaHaR_3_96 TaxID=2745560 RepID=UPI001C4F21D2|nr:OmpA family protein [Olleya sp. HaHaR_3_96]QXP58764.1 OmpA family protein [Olleya sp. HaHaR_3_96]
MSNVTKIQEGAAVLQQVDVSDIFTSLAMGIADAQKKLDDNSIAQITKLANTTLGDKSLLELGFAPAFYSFTYADISANIHLKMTMKDEFALSVQVDATYNSGKQGKDDYKNVEKEKAFNSEKSSFKSSRKFLMKSSSKNAVVINDNHYKLDESIGIVSRIDEFHSEIIQSQDVERLNYSVLQQFVTHYTPSVDFTILKITDYSGNDVDKDGTGNITGEITIGSSDFSSVYSASGGVYGFSEQLIYGSTVSPKDLEFHFGFDKRILNFNYAQGTIDNAGKDAEFEALASILREDDTANILIKGYTDSSGADAYNINLSKDRCEAMRDYLVAQGARATQIHIEPKGETLARANSGPDDTKNEVFRKVSIAITSGADYIYFNSVLIGAIPDTDANYFITNSNSSILISSSAEDISDYWTEKRQSINYYLDKETQIEFSAYSKTSESINISKQEEEGAVDEVKIAQSENTSQLLSDNSGNSKSNETVALGLNVDLRMSKQFEMSVEGNSSMSARMISLPPPDGFLKYVDSLIE